MESNAYVNVSHDDDGFLIELIADGYEKDIEHTSSPNEKNSAVRRFQAEADRLNKKI